VSKRKSLRVVFGTTISTPPFRCSKARTGFELTLIRRIGRAAIYRQHLPGGNPDHDAYEVVLPQSRNTNHKGEPVEPYEGYPAAELWGKKGWTFTSLAKALQKLKERAQKASCAGSVSRRNRLNGPPGSRGRGLKPTASRLMLASNSLVKQSRQTRMQRQATDVFGPRPVFHGFRQLQATQGMHSQQTVTIDPPDATESKRV
jgi:hypothetical protein